MKKATLLIIDDEENILHALERELREDYEVVTARTAQEAFEAVDNRHIDGAICDYNLSDRNGVELLEEIIQRRPSIIPILLTGHADVTMAIDAVNRLHLSGFVMKPWNSEELHQTLRRALEKNSLRRLKATKAKDIMSKFAITASDDIALSEVAHLMMRFKISGVPVVSNEGEIIGIITATDLFRVMGEAVNNSSQAQGFSEVRVLIRDVMSRNVFTVTREMTLFEIIGIMNEKNIHTLPVVENKEIVGIIGRRDVINAFYDLFGTKQ